MLIADDLIDYPLRFYGLSYLKSRIRKSRQIVFEGNMLSEEDNGDDRVEPFKAVVTDKSITKQGIWIKIQVGDYFGEGSVEDVFFRLSYRVGSY